MRCVNCEKAIESEAPPAPRKADESSRPEGSCEECGTPLDGAALSDFVDRLARFGLDAKMQPLLGRFPRVMRRE